MFTLICECCSTSFQSSSSRQRYCSRSCAVKVNNKLHPKRKAHTFLCPGCLEEKRGSKKQIYCSLTCMQVAKRKATIEAFLAGDPVPKSKAVREYILATQGGHCAVCPLTPEWNGAPLVFILDHIDGDSTNDSPNNLRLVCPNCDSQLPTFKSRNRGNGRHYRRERYAAGKSF